MKSLKRIAAFLIAVIISATMITGCSSRGKKLLELEDNDITVNMFSLYLSRMKGNLSSSYSFGEVALTDEFWDTVINVSTGQTYNDYYTQMVLDNAKTYLAALHLFDVRGLKLPDSYIDEIDAELDRLVEEEADGSKNTFNAMLAVYGANYDVLREAYIIEAKISYLRDDLFGANGEKIASNLVEDHYNHNYRRFKQIFYSTYDLVYETDSNGDDIYYTESGSIAYDKNATPKTDSEGNLVKDSHGNNIYLTEDGKIAYDTVKGTRKPIKDSNGNEMSESMTAEEIEAVIFKVQSVMEVVVEGDTQHFDSLVKSESVANEDEKMLERDNGYYTGNTSDPYAYYATEVVEALFEMNVGEVRMIRSEYGYHIVMRYENEPGGYALKDNSDFFVSTTGSGYLFMSGLMNQLFTDYLAQYKALVTVDEDALKGVDIKSVGANYHY